MRRDTLNDYDEKKGPYRIGPPCAKIKSRQTSILYKIIVSIYT